MTKLLLAFGIVFELPVAVGFLSFVGLITHRHLIRFWRWALVVAFVLGAALTPPDLVSQLFLAVPLCVLYAISIVIAYLITSRREKDEDGNPPPGHEGDAETPPDPPGPIGPVYTQAPDPFDDDLDDDLESHNSDGPQEEAEGVDPEQTAYEQSVADRQLSMPFRGQEPVHSDEDGQPSSDQDDAEDDVPKVQPSEETEEE